MKKLPISSALALLALATLLGTCSKESLPDKAGASNDAITVRDGMREIPFKARFFTRLTPDRLGEVVCDDPELPGPNFQTGGGNATHLGRFSTELTFCGGAGGVYGGAEGYLEAANGDRLFIAIESGQVILFEPGSQPYYDAYFKDPFTITGGTGRFEGASGGGMTDSLVDLWNEDYPFPGPIIPDHRTDHVWTGTLMLPNGK